MSSSSIRRTRLPDSNESPELLEQLSNGGISVEAFDNKPVSVLCEDYPFDGQTIYYGDLIYDEESKWGTGRTIQIHFEYRSKSEMFILNFDVDVPSVKDIISHLNNSAPSGVRISRNLTVNREALWQFLKGSDKVIDISVLDDHGEEVSFDKLEDVTREGAIGSYPVEDATVVFSHSDEQIVVQYNSGSLNVNSDWEHATEYIVQLFERDVIAE